MFKRKSLFQKGSAKIFFATISAFALIFVMPMQPLKLRDKPPSWKFMGERYGVGWQFRFGKSDEWLSEMCNGTCTIMSVMAAQRNNFGPIYYERRCEGNYKTGDSKNLGKPNADGDRLFAELK